MSGISDEPFVQLAVDCPPYPSVAYHDAVPAAGMCWQENLSVDGHTLLDDADPRSVARFRGSALGYIFPGQCRVATRPQVALHPMHSRIRRPVRGYVDVSNAGGELPMSNRLFRAQEVVVAICTRPYATAVFQRRPLFSQQLRHGQGLRLHLR
eukprot:CAMPEP_0171068808 /NCGR_PEP_ID=MMETSP0766_2-20121228/8788_1 /TAXON_ID=439317 /ORGANISM="Gambierdiscus australes, Strain CAWD 149" /LENGTH=152 /DNA_ID=CAMNT_0011525157 /DNA_START=83 /DNA_END=541 /DNA_ORIENTATION=+